MLDIENLCIHFFFLGRIKTYLQTSGRGVRLQLPLLLVLTGTSHTRFPATTKTSWVFISV